MIICLNKTFRARIQWLSGRLFIEKLLFLGAASASFLLAGAELEIGKNKNIMEKKMKVSEYGATLKTVNDYEGKTDNDRIEAAIRGRNGNIVIIPKRVSNIEPDRTWWKLDRAILLPSNTTIVLQDCKIKLSDKCRDNFFRSANCGLGIEEPGSVENIHIKGIGCCILEGADHPRSTGDSTKILACPCPRNFSGSAKPTFADLHAHTYGTDALVKGESPYGDWRNIGILFAKVSHFSIENIRIVEQHGWAISLEDCTYGNVSHIDFSASQKRIIDGAEHNVENQDGVNLRNGCHDIIVSDITGKTGDDVIALTAITTPQWKLKSGRMRSSHVLGNDWTRREMGIRNVIIRNVLAYPAGGCSIIRLLGIEGGEIHNVSIDNVIDASPDDFHVLDDIALGKAPGIVGEPGHPYGKQFEQALFNINVSNVNGNARHSVRVLGGLQNSCISNVINRNPAGISLKIENPDLIIDSVQSGIVNRKKP